MALTVVLGARRSGKSRVAEQLAAGAGAPVTVVAPLTVTDREMEERVAAHRRARPAAWRTAETSDVVTTVRASPDRDCLLMDSVGTWLSEILWRTGALDDPGGAGATAQRLLDDVDELAHLAVARSGEVVCIVEQAGWGPVPPDAATRLWLDLLGDAAQRLAEHADRTLLVVAGRTLELP